jgi:hypothetical protein
MLVAVVIYLGVADGRGHHHGAFDSLAISLAAVGVHTAAMLALTGAVAALVCERVGLAFLRRSWISLDLVWVVALAIAGVILLL